MNQFLTIAKQAILMHGEPCTYSKVTTGSYDVNTGMVTNSESSSLITAYRKHIRANQYNYPNLVGKDAIIAYITADSIVGLPSVNDKLTFGSTTYTASSIQEHRALNELVLYRIACYKA